MVDSSKQAPDSPSSAVRNASRFFLPGIKINCPLSLSPPPGRVDATLPPNRWIGKSAPNRRRAGINARLKSKAAGFKASNALAPVGFSHFL